MRFSIYNNIKQRKAANLHILEAGPRECLAFLINDLTNNQLAKKTCSFSINRQINESAKCFRSTNKQLNLNIDTVTRPHPLPVLAQPMWSTVSLPTGVDGQRLVLRRALVLRNHATLRSLTVHMTHHLPLAA